MAIQEAETEHQPILVDRRGHIGVVTFNNPAKHNAMSLDMWRGAREAVASFADDDNIRCVVFTGAGNKAFVAGADISKFENERSSVTHIEAYNKAVSEYHRSVQNLMKPTIARIDGYCIGGGLAIALDADIRIASDDSRYAVPAAKLGIGYVFEGIRRLYDIVGPAFVAEIFYTARQFDAEEARIMGLVNRVVPKAELDDVVWPLAERIAGNAPLSVQAVKASLIELAKPQAEWDLAKPEAAVRKCFDSNDYKEGRTAFMEKRKPVFTAS
ncbi:MAG: enoyl-CoA hydratase/isomerase family protein [Alphaproteobacteria bacterium]|nr:enoyl-CoA hydratase/isomerase family protein [Alphaproteobacteria bacterium]